MLVEMNMNDKCNETSPNYQPSQQRLDDRIHAEAEDAGDQIGRSNDLGNWGFHQPQLDLFKQRKKGRMIIYTLVN